MTANQDLCFSVQVFCDFNVLIFIVTVSFCELTALMVTCTNQLKIDCVLQG